MIIFLGGSGILAIPENTVRYLKDNIFAPLFQSVFSSLPDFQ